MKFIKAMNNINQDNKNELVEHDSDSNENLAESICNTYNVQFIAEMVFPLIILESVKKQFLPHIGHKRQSITEIRLGNINKTCREYVGNTTEYIHPTFEPCIIKSIKQIIDEICDLMSKMSTRKINSGKYIILILPCYNSTKKIYELIRQGIKGECLQDSINIIHKKMKETDFFIIRDVYSKQIVFSGDKFNDINLKFMTGINSSESVMSPEYYDGTWRGLSADIVYIWIDTIFSSNIPSIIHHNIS